MGFQQGLSGLNAASKALDATGNNIANSSTVGFKAANAQFADVYAASLAGAGATQIGIGTSVGGVAQQFTQGNITTTNNSLDIAVNGSGFFRMDDNGSVTWTRNGQFQVDKDGYIINAQGARLTGYLANANGTIIQSSPSDILIDTSDLQPVATGSGTPATGLMMGLNLDSRETTPTTATFSPNDPTSYNKSTSATVYDSLGNPHTLALYFVKSATANQWSLYTTLDGGAASAGTTLTFSSSGALQSPPVNGIVTQSFALTNGASTPLTFPLNLTGTTQYGSVFGVNSLSQDGYASGRLSGLSVSSDGTVQGQYSNGQTRNLAQIVLGKFTNPNGLMSMGGNQWAETSASGQPLIGVPGSGALGVLQSGAVEDSNVDLTQELVNLITEQRNYQANAQTIKTQDQVLQTLVNLQ
jgi:flagellar hook protein FlgE